MTDFPTPQEFEAHIPPISRQELRRGLNVYLRDSLPAITLVFSALFLLFTIKHIQTLPPEHSRIMAPLAGVTTALNLGLYFYLRRHALPERWAHPLTGALAVVMAGNTLTHLALNRTPLQTTNVILIIIGAGFLLLSTWWWAGVVGAMWLAWGIIVLTLPPSWMWSHFVFAMVSATAVSLLVQVVRMRTYRRLESLRISNDHRQMRLQMALQSTEQVQRALETTIDVGQHLSSILDMENLLNQVVQIIKSRYGYYFIGIFLLDESGEHLIARAGTGEAGRAFCESGYRIAVGQGIIGWAAQSREAVNVSNVTQEPRHLPADVVPDTRSELALPLIVAGDLLGVLDIQSERIWAFSDDDVRVLQALSGQVAIALQNAALYEMERQQRLFAEKLYDVGRALTHTQHLPEVLELILDQLADIVPYDRGSMILQSDDPDVMILKAARGFPPGSQPLNLRIIIKEGDIFEDLRRTQRPLLIPDVRQRADWEYVEHLPPARSWLGIPLNLGDAVIGMLSLVRERPEPYTEEEVSLAETFASQAAVALENARLYDNITQINTRLEETVEELRKRSEDLEIAYAQLERLDRTKSDFIGVASHELRTPLTVLSGYSQILFDDRQIQADPYKHQLVTGIKNGTERLHTIVASMLDMVKIDSRAMQLHPEVVSLALVIETIRRKLDDVLGQRNLTLTLEGIAALPQIEVDVEAIRKVFHQLLLNAIKYTPDGGAVTMVGSDVLPGDEFPEGGVEIVVSDTGIGINPAYHELIFAKFYQTGEVAVHSSGTTKFKGGGPGLGLAIARGIIDAHGGKIWVESPGYDEDACPGSQFHVVLPMTARVLLKE